MKFNFLVIIVLISGSCNNSPERAVNVRKPDVNEMADLNKFMVEKDHERIVNYLERKKIPAKESSTGLWYYIKKEGSGEFFKENDKVVFFYVCSLLDGTECYNSEKLGPKEFTVGKSDIEAGLNEGFHLLKRGGEAIFILPSYLAYGLVGDGKSIPSRAVLVYYVRVAEGY